jgi:heme exporter protein A
VSTDAAVELDGVARAYGERLVLRDVSFTLPAGRTLAVFGANGAGKTTLLRILATLLRPHAGEARVLGSALPREGWAVRGRIGLVAHDPLLYRDLTARENLRFHARLYGVAFARIDTLLEAVGLERRGDEPVHTFSRGMV